jgi:hypothetical protein
MQPMQRLVAAAAVAVLLCAGVAGAEVSAAATPNWADRADATIHPGVQTDTDGNQCTANFVFYDDTDVFIGQAAHCASTEGAVAANGCETETLPLGTPVTVGGADQPGTLSYSSWVAMQEVDESDTNACRYNDFALVRLDPSDHGKVNPTMPFWGGPTGLASGSSIGELVYSYGNSPLWMGTSTLQPKEGYSLGTAGDGWTHDVYTFTPGVPGDSGSGYINADGQALGSLSTLQVAPVAGSNGVTDLRMALDYLAEHSSLDVTLALGTEPEGEACPSDAEHDFTDVDPESVHNDAIACRGVVHGFGDGTYRPALAVRRDQMATFIARTLAAAGHELPPADGQGYEDIDGNPHADAINRLSEAGIVRGTSWSTYTPAAGVRRDQVASLLVRSAEWAAGTTLEPEGGPYFEDTAGNTHERQIDIAYEHGLVTGSRPPADGRLGEYAPHLSTTRAQMASVTARLLELLWPQ